MLPTLRNLLTSLPSARDAEMSETLITAHGIRLQRIISFGQVSPEGFWYDQKEAEWVMLLTGRARLVIAGEAEERILGPGGVSLNIRSLLSRTLPVL
jgi:cupin 2 domain-containing protein